MSNDADVDAALEQVWGLPGKMRTYGQSRSVVGCAYGGSYTAKTYDLPATLRDGSKES